MTTQRLLRISLGISAGVLVSLWILRPPSERVGSDAFLPAPLPPPALDLTAHTGERVTGESLRGRPAAIFFGYTHCPDICPVTMAHLARAMDELDLGPDELRVAFVTVDPARDTPEVLARFVGAFHPSFVGLTGPEDVVREQALGFGVAFERQGEGEDYLVDHGARTFLLDREGRIVGTIRPGEGYASVRNGIEALLERGR